MIELMWGKGGTGIKEWQPTCPYFQGFVNKSRDIVDKGVSSRSSYESFVCVLTCLFIDSCTREGVCTIGCEKD